MNDFSELAEGFVRLRSAGHITHNVTHYNLNETITRDDGNHTCSTGTKVKKNGSNERWNNAVVCEITFNNALRISNSNFPVSECPNACIVVG